MLSPVTYIMKSYINFARSLYELHICMPYMHSAGDCLTFHIMNKGICQPDGGECKE